MKRVAILAAVAALAAPGVFAQSAVTSSTGAPVSSGTGAVVTPASPAPAMAVEPATVSTPAPRLLSGGTIVQHSSTTTMGAAGTATTKTIVTSSWANVPANVERRGDFQRWQALK